MADIIVVGLAGRETEDFAEWLDGRSVIARCGAHATGRLPEGVRLAAWHDELYDGHVVDLELAVALDVAGRAREQAVVYLVPGIAWAGDLTVAAILDAAPAAVILDPGGAPLGLLGESPAQIVDALALAQAEAAEPFGAGLYSIDTAAPLLVTNWHGDTVIELATRRLTRLHGYVNLPDPDDDLNLLLDAQDILDARGSLPALRRIYARLRRPSGCPWDREQTELTTLPHISEEVDELRDALEREDWQHAAEELGDVLGNVLMIAQIAHEQGRFSFEDALTSMSAKLVRRHPHVFGDAHAANPDEVLELWNQIKQQERNVKRQRAEGHEQP